MFTIVAEERSANGNEPAVPRLVLFVLDEPLGFLLRQSTNPSDRPLHALEARWLEKEKRLKKLHYLRSSTDDHKQYDNAVARRIRHLPVDETYSECKECKIATTRASESKETAMLNRNIITKKWVSSPVVAEKNQYVLSKAMFRYGRGVLIMFAVKAATVSLLPSPVNIF